MLHKNQISSKESKWQSNGEADGALCWQAKKPKQQKPNPNKLLEIKIKWEAKYYF